MKYSFNYKKFKSNFIESFYDVLFMMAMLSPMIFVAIISNSNHSKQKSYKENIVFVIDGTDITFQDEVKSTYACRFGVVYLLPHYSKGSEVVMLDINGKPLTCSIWKK